MSPLRITGSLWDRMFHLPVARSSRILTGLNTLLMSSASIASRSSSAPRHTHTTGPSAPLCTRGRRRAGAALNSIPTAAVPAQTSARVYAGGATSVAFPMGSLSAGFTQRATGPRCARMGCTAHAGCASLHTLCRSFALGPFLRITHLSGTGSSHPPLHRPRRCSRRRPSWDRYQLPKKSWQTSPGGRSRATTPQTLRKGSSLVAAARCS
mmetsp:Transcript_39239/g.111092  ORF Transcript_39239/g.111092 Transcript_39239/m.111092 type:complete len:210 (-) Transcript_39239:1546-2175(-)